MEPRTLNIMQKELTILQKKFRKGYRWAIINPNGSLNIDSFFTDAIEAIDFCNTNSLALQTQILTISYITKFFLQKSTNRYNYSKLCELNKRLLETPLTLLAPVKITAHLLAFEDYIPVEYRSVQEPLIDCRIYYIYKISSENKSKTILLLHETDNFKKALNKFNQLCKTIHYASFRIYLVGIYHGATFKVLASGKVDENTGVNFYLYETAHTYSRLIQLHDPTTQLIQRFIYFIRFFSPIKTIKIYNTELKVTRIGQDLQSIHTTYKLQAPFHETT